MSDSNYFSNCIDVVGKNGENIINPQMHILIAQNMCRTAN
jgi:hypothetical protein